MTQVQGLAAAAEALETELTRFEELTSALQRERLNSEKAIKRSAQRLEQLAECDLRLAQHLQGLVGAIGLARQRQEQHAATVQSCALALQERAGALAALHTQGEALRDQVAELNQRTQDLLGSTNGDHEAAAVRGAFTELQLALGALAERASALAESAHAEGFGDVARDGESLRAQLLATKNKLELLERKLG